VTFSDIDLLALSKDHEEHSAVVDFQLLNRVSNFGRSVSHNNIQNELLLSHVGSFYNPITVTNI
jgi:CII-binding regulator of phage lambda lysogenization HflD